MFDSMGRNERLHATTYFVSLLFSLFVHAVVLCVLITLPMIFLNALHEDELLTILYGPPPPPAPPPLPVAPVHRAAAPSFIAHSDLDIAPVQIPKGVAPPENIPTEFGLERLVPKDGFSGKGREDIGDILTTLLPKEVPKPPEPVMPPRRERIRVGTIQESKLIFKPEPVYPELARRARVSGTVVLDVQIDEEGNVSDVRVLSGHPLLTGAAVEAVRRWKYTPTVLNGEPVPIVATVTVIFRLY